MPMITQTLGLEPESATARALREVSTSDLLEAYFGLEEDHTIDEKDDVNEAQRM